MNLNKIIEQKFIQFVQTKEASPQEVLALLAQFAKNFYIKLFKKDTSLDIIKKEGLKKLNIPNSDLMAKEIFEELEKNKVSNISKKQYLNTINWIIEQWNELDTSNTSKSTNSLYVKIIQNTAKQLSEGPYIDLAIGTGRILENLGNLVKPMKSGMGIPLGTRVIQSIQDTFFLNYGFDLDVNVKYIADALLNYEEETVKINLGTKEDDDSIKNVYNILNFKEWEETQPVFIFDPPLGVKSVQQRPLEWQKLNLKNYNNIFGPNNQSEYEESTTDVLFLANYLLNAPKKSFFIGLFPERFLNNENKEYPALRRYLVENSLRYVISIESGLTILVGEKSNKSELPPNILVIKIKKTITDDKLNEVISNIDNKEEIVKLNAGVIFYERKNLLKHTNCIINLPSLPINKEIKELVPSLTLINNIWDIEKDLIIKVHNIKKQIEIIPSLQDEKNKIEEKKVESIQPIVSEQLWFEIAEKEGDQTATILNYLQNFISVQITSNCQNMISILDLEKIKKFYKENVHKFPDFFEHLNYLYSKNRFDLKTFEINFNKEIQNMPKNQPNEFYNTMKNLTHNSDQLLQIVTNEIYINIYDIFCKYWFLKHNNIKDLEHKYTNSEITLAIKVLKEFGLIIETPTTNISKTSTYIYDVNRPFHCWIDGGLE